MTAAELILLARRARVARSHDEALELLARAAATEGPEAELALEWRAGMLSKLGRYHQALALATEATRARPEIARRRIWAAHLFRARYDRGTALSHIEALGNSAPRLRREALELAIAADSRIDEHAEHAGAERDPELRLALARVLRRAGRPNRAQELLAGLECHGAFAERAALALWEGDIDGARALATRDAGAALAHRCLGAAALLTRDLLGAERELDRALALDALDEETHVLLAETHLRARRTSAAESALTRAIEHVDGASEFLPVIALRQKLAGKPLQPLMGEEGIVVAARELGALAMTREDPLAPDVLLGLLRGNRSLTPSTTSPSGALELVRVLPSSRTLARWAQRTIEHAGPEAAIRAFDPVFARYPKSAWPLNYRGEVHLWLGSLARADEDFQSAIRLNDRAFWAFVGRAAVQLLSGHPAEAVAICESAISLTGRVGPTLFIYRGEALRRLGARERAIADLERACSEHPTRVSAWINLALVVSEDRQREIFARLRSVASALLADAASEVSVAPAVDASAPRDDLARVLEHALSMMRGNRSSSCMTYFTARGELRFVSRDVLDDGEELAAVQVIAERLARRSRRLSL